MTAAAVSALAVMVAVGVVGEGLAGAAGLDDADLLVGPVERRGEGDAALGLGDPVAVEVVGVRAVGRQARAGRHPTDGVVGEGLSPGARVACHRRQAARLGGDVAVTVVGLAEGERALGDPDRPLTGAKPRGMTESTAYLDKVGLTTLMSRYADDGRLCDAVRGGYRRR